MARRRLPALVGLGVLAVAVPVWYWNRPTTPIVAFDTSIYTEQTRHAIIPATCDRVEHLDQGWTAGEAADFYSHTQGSRLLPYAWFIVLERADSISPFSEPANLARYGFLTRTASQGNPDGLPIGFARDPRGPREKHDWLGFTCAACHTAEIHYARVAYRIDGGPAMADLQRFLADLTAALIALRDDPAKFARFTTAVRARDRRAGTDPELREQVAAECQKRLTYESTNKTPHPYGPARLDAFGRIVNTILTTAIGVADPDQAKSPDAPVSYPFLWDAPHHDYVQWNGVARNKVLGSDAMGGLARNVGEVLGVFGEVEVSRPGTALALKGYDSSARIPDLMHLEQLLKKLQSPQWPSAFPPIDEPTRAAGEKLFAKYCQTCHAEIDRADPNRSIAAVRTPIKVVKTDPRMATNFATRTGKTGRLDGRRTYFVTGDRFGREASADAILLHTVVGVVLGSPWKDYQETHLTTLRDHSTDADPDRLLVYKARPLNGIWATAPYLHNGSVPSLYQLLLPATERMTSFTIGNREFDPKCVGFRVDDPDGFRFETKWPGNANIGHEYGTGNDGLPALTDAERWQVVEYLKSL